MIARASRLGERFRTLAARELCIAAIIATAGYAAALPVRTAGYLYDEELTVAAVQGIRAHGSPVLPSGVLYDRGLLYSYGAWAGGTLFGQSLFSYRMVSVAASILGLIIVRLLAGSGRPWLAGGMIVALAADPLFRDIAHWARFYALFAACALGAILAFDRFVRSASGEIPFIACVVAARLSHELGVLLILLPVCLAFLDDYDHKRRALRGLVLTLAVLVVCQLAIVGAHALASTASGDALRDVLALQLAEALVRPTLPMAAVRPQYLLVTLGVLGGCFAFLYRFVGLRDGWLWLAAACVATGQAGLLLAAWVVLLGARPSRARQSTLIAATMLVGVVTSEAVAVAASTRTTFSPSLMASTVAAAVSYPWSTFRLVAEVRPLLIVALTAALGAAAIGRGVGVFARTLVLAAMAMLFVLGALNIGEAERYVVLPALMAVVGIVRTVLDVSHASLGSTTRRAGPLLAIAVLWGSGVSASYAAPGSSDLAFHPSWYRLLDEIEPRDVVACNDELACYTTLGRVDYWLAVDRRDVAHFTLLREGGAVGLYAGAPVIDDRQRLERAIRRARERARRFWIVVLDTGKYNLAALAPLISDTDEQFDRVLSSEDERALIMRAAQGGTVH